MIAILHVACLTSRSGSPRRQNSALLQIRPHPMLRRRIHLPLRMVESHVAGLAGLRRLGFLNRKCMARMAGIARSRAEFAALVLQLADIRHWLLANLVAPTATFLARDQGHRL